MLGVGLLVHCASWRCCHLLIQYLCIGSIDYTIYIIKTYSRVRANFCMTFLTQLLSLAACSNTYDINLGLLTHKVLPLKSLVMSQEPMEHKFLILQKKVTLDCYQINWNKQNDLKVMLEVIRLCTILPGHHCIYLILNKHKPPHYMICFLYSIFN